MIEKYLITNSQSLKRWRRFKANRNSVIASWFFLFILLLSVTAEIWANNKPIMMSYKGSIYFPVLKNYHPTDLHLKTNASIIDYRQLDFSSSSHWAVWPLINWDPFESNTNVDHYPSPPSTHNWLGTDDRGRDILARLVYGFRYSISFAIMVWLAAYTIGTLAGAFMGFIGGRLDIIGQRFVEIIETIPFLLLLITLVDLIGVSSIFLLVMLFAGFRWINISNYIRAEFLKLRKREFVDICHAQGMNRFRIMFKHIFPNALNPIVTFAPFAIANGVYVLSLLDYLGFGLPPPTPSWGELLAQAEQHFMVAWWLALFPSLALFLTLVSLYFIGDGVRTAFDTHSSPAKSIN